MEGLILVVVLGATILGGGMLAQRIPVPAPLILLLAGAALSFVPGIHVELPPELVLLLFLPALLYWESLNTSLREILDNLRVIVLLAVGLVFLTAFAIAWLASSFGLPWPMALALGAILSPTDATAVAAVVRRLPRRQGTILRAESLLNDGTALVLYSVAVGAATAGASITAGSLSVQFLYAYAVGIGIGLAIGFAAYQVRKLFRGDRLLSGTLSVLTPFIAYLPAELIGASGVVAVVVCGLVISQVGPRIITAATRAQTFGFWQLTSYVLNGALFVLIGLELKPVLDGLGADWPSALLFGLACAVGVMAVRLLWGVTTPYLIRLVDRRPVQRTRRVGFRQRFPISWAGFRGAVSLAAALALPQQTEGGEPLPGRDLVIAVTFVVILFTLVVQGLTLPAVVRWSGLGRDPREFDEELLGEQAMLQAALDALPVAAGELGTSRPIVDGLRTSYEDRLRLIHREDGRPEAAIRDASTRDEEDALHLAILPAKRAALLGLRHERRIDDVILRRLQSRIDLEELRLSAPADED
ncbi:Na+/H+ antiporter [Agromyces humi]|uniref:Na+/H+ antiporter n=1 Tax=Agromyces humi TaxID=1766800 RepID=UPI001356A13D|nr:Na+/H+ antiporter [Agromyces humi]